MWIIPVFFAANLGRATVFSLLAGLFVFFVYYTFRADQWPLASYHTGTFLAPSWLFGLVAWAYLAQYLLSSIAGALRLRGQRASH